MERVRAYLGAAVIAGLFAAAGACRESVKHDRETVGELSLAADPDVAEVGGRVAVRVDGRQAEDFLEGSAVWEASGGSFTAKRDHACEWIAPQRIGTYTIRFSAVDAEGRRMEAAMSLEVRRFGQPPSPDCTIACDNIYESYAERDQIPVLDDPKILGAVDSGSLGADLPVVGIVQGHEARAYPITVLAYHEVINDEVGGKRVTVSYSPLADFAAVFADNRGGFGHTGSLYEGFHLLYDRESDSLWFPASGECVRGAYKGEKLRAAVALRTTWAAWKALHPDTTVLWPDPVPPSNFRYDRDPYDWYAQDNDFIPGRLTYHDLRLPRKARVLGLWHGGMARAYLLEDLGERAVLNDELSGRGFVIVADAGSAAYAAFRSFAEGRNLTFLSAIGGAGGAFMRDEQTGTLWDITGKALEGPLAGSRLEPAPAYRGFFFSWAAFRQGSEIWKAEKVIIDPKEDKGGTS